MMKYRFIDHTADVMFEAYGRDLNKLFENSALATFDVQCNLKKVERKIKRKIKLKNNDVEKLLFDFLEELVYLKDAKCLLFSKFKIKIIEKNGKLFLDSVAEGDKINNKHNLKTDVKAVTLHKFEIKKIKGIYKARVILDI